MLPFVAAGVAAGGVSYFIGLPLAYAAFLAIAIVAVAVGVTSALTVKVPQIEPKARKLKTEKSRHGSAAASSSLSSDTAADTSEKPDKAEDNNNNKSEPKALSKRDKERAKKAAKKEADEKQKQAEADRAAAEEKQKQQEAARVAKEAAAAAAKAAEAAEKERLAALEAEEDEEDEAPAKKNKKKKKKKTEEKKGNDSAAPTPTAKSSESKNAAPTPTAKSSAPTPAAKKGEAADSKKSKDSSAKAEAASNKVDASKKVEVAPKNTESPKHTPAAAVEFEEKVDAKESAAQDSSMAWEVKTSKKNKRAPEPAAAAAAVIPLTPTTTSASSDQKVETTIDPRNFGVIIGKGGSTLKQIMEATQTNIDFSKKEEGRVTVSGPSRENIDKAVAAMNQLAAKGYSDLTHGVRDEGSIEVPSNKRFNIIGTKGETVRLIQDRLKVKVNMPDRNTNDSTVTVLGENADVQEALRCISDLMTKGYSEITHPGWVSEIVEVPSGQLGNIIGAQGATVREIQDSTGAKINIEGSTVTVLGQQTQVAEAKNKITQLLTPAEPLPADPEWSQGASARYVDLW